MRKRYKNKKRSCATCKPWKRECQKYYNPKELQALQELRPLKYGVIKEVSVEKL